MKKILFTALLVVVAVTLAFSQSGETFRGHYTTVASATAVTLSEGATHYSVTGTTTITSIVARPAGTVVWLCFAGSLTFTDGSNLKLAGNFSATADDVVQLVCDGTDWYEVKRSAN